MKLQDGNYILYEIEAVDVSGTNVLKIITIELDYCIQPTTACQCDELWNNIMEQKVAWAHDQRIKDYAHQIAVGPYAPYQSYPIYEQRCLCNLRAAHSRGFRYVRLVHSDNPTPECTAKQIMKASNLKEICQGYIANQCGNNGIMMTRE